MGNFSTNSYNSTRHAKFLVNYHFIWCPKYRYDILASKEVQETVLNAIIDRVDELNCSVIAVEIMPDHIHLSLSAPPKYSPAEIIASIKSVSGSIIASKFPDLKSRGKIWSNSYFCATTGNVSTETIKRYIESQWQRIS